LESQPVPVMPCTADGLSSPFVRLVADIGYPVLSRAVGALMHCHAVVTHLPQGPSLRLANGNLVAHMRPTRGHSAPSPHGGLYALPSPCRSAWATRERFRSFADHSVLSCPPLRTRGVRTSISSSAAMSTLAFAELPAARHSQNSRHFEASTVHPF